MAADRTIELANQLLMQGQLAEVERLFREFLGQRPGSLPRSGARRGAVSARTAGGSGPGVCPRGGDRAPVGSISRQPGGSPARPERLIRRLIISVRLSRLIRPTSWRGIAWAWVSFDCGRYEAAADAYNEAIRLNSRFVRARVNLAECFVRWDSSVMRWMCSARPLRSNPTIPGSDQSGNRALRAGRAVRAIEAEAVGRDAVSLSPRHPRARRTRSRASPARARGTGGEFERGLRVRASRDVRDQRGRDAGPADFAGAQARYTEGTLYLTEGRTDLAEASLREAIRLDPTMASAGWRWRPFRQRPTDGGFL